MGFPWSPDNGKGGFQGVCWKCGAKGHRSFECPNASMIQGIEDQSIQVDSSIKADACSVDVGKKSWHVGAVERLPHAARRQ
eukprot:6508069-Karenia_brevis.AAC.1